jgi:hypothetical protein
LLHFRIAIDRQAKQIRQNPKRARVAENRKDRRIEGLA